MKSDTERDCSRGRVGRAITVFPGEYFTSTWHARGAGGLIRNTAERKKGWEKRDASLGPLSVSRHPCIGFSQTKRAISRLKNPASKGDRSLPVPVPKASRNALERRRLDTTLAEVTSSPARIDPRHPSGRPLFFPRFLATGYLGSPAAAATPHGM